MYCPRHGRHPSRITGGCEEEEGGEGEWLRHRSRSSEIDGQNLKFEVRDLQWLIPIIFYYVLEQHTTHRELVALVD